MSGEGAGSGIGTSKGGGPPQLWEAEPHPTGRGEWGFRQAVTQAVRTLEASLWQHFGEWVSQQEEGQG